MRGTHTRAPITSSCTSWSLRVGEPMAGTARTTPTWLCIEQPGPWGSDALRESRLDPGVVEQLERRLDSTGVQMVLIRRPGTHAAVRDAPRQVFLAATHPDHTWLRHASVTDPLELLDWDFSAVARGDEAAVGFPSPDPLLLVCTHGRRDLCCALIGRPLAMEMSRRRPERVWESSHLGGHRFSPTVVALPTGYAYGRVGPDLCERVLSESEAGRVVVDSCRGRSTWNGPGQVAELTIRRMLGERSADALVVTDESRLCEGHWQVRVSHHTGRHWHVTVRTQATPPARPASCGKQAKVPTAHVVDGWTPG